MNADAAGLDTGVDLPIDVGGNIVGGDAIPAPIRAAVEPATARPCGHPERPTSVRRESFQVRLAVVGGPDWELRNVVVDVQEQLHQRERIRGPRVAWDRAGHRIVVEVEVQGRGAGRAAAGVAAELLDITGALLDESTQCRVEVLDAQPTARRASVPARAWSDDDRPPAGR
jgi:hypothetical protein